MTANADVAEFTAQPDSTIGGLVRNGEGHLVSGNTEIEAGDIVVVFCHNVNMSKIEKFFN